MRYMTAKDIADEMGIHIETAREWMNQMPCMTVGRIKRVSESAFTEFVEKHTQTARSADIPNRSRLTNTPRKRTVCNSAMCGLTPEGKLVRRGGHAVSKV